MKTFSDTKYGNLTGEVYNGNIDVRDTNISSLKGSPRTVYGSFNCSSLKHLTSLEYAPKEISGTFFCTNSPIVNAREQIIKYQIKADTYYTSDEMFFYQEIEQALKDADKLDKRVVRKSMRTLLGLDK